MEWNDLHIRIGATRRSGQRRLTFRWRDVHDLPREFEWFCPPQVSRQGAGDIPLEGVAIQEVIAEAYERHVLPAVHSGLNRILLEIAPQAIELSWIAWENDLQSLHPNIQSVVRYIDRSDQWVGIPIDLPARTLRATGLHRSLGFRASSAEKEYYRLHRVNNISDHSLVAVLQSSTFDVVHLGVRIVEDSKDPNTTSVSIQLPDGSLTGGLAAHQLVAALSSAKARLLILEGTIEDYVSLLTFAHLLQCAGGPSTLVLGEPHREAAEAIYLDIVHNRDLAEIAVGLRPNCPLCVLLIAALGEQTLSITPNEFQLSGGTQRVTFLMDKIASNLRFPASPSDAAPWWDRHADLRIKTDRLRQQTYNMSSEQGAWVPFAANQVKVGELQREVLAFHSMASRVLNVGLLRQGVSVAPDDIIAPSTDYDIAVQVARIATWSLVERPAALPEEWLTGKYESEGLPLSVIVSGPGSLSEPKVFEFFLPPAPLASEPKLVTYRTPDEAGPVRIRVGIYYKNNLLQSVILKFVVVAGSQESSKSRSQLTAEVEFALTDNFERPERLPPRTVNILCNATDTGSHTFQVIGGSLRKSFDFGEGQMRAAVNAVRKALLDIAADQSSGKPRYRFDANNRGTLSQLEKDLCRLAERGHTLFSQIVTGEDRPFKAQLLQALGPKADIQIASTKSARYVFPWALVYDKPFVLGVNRLCPAFASDVAADPTLTNWRCLNSGCPHTGDDSIVCPSGFWGFKHILEQPLSVKDKDGGTGVSELTTELKAGPKGGRVPALMAVSRNLDFAGTHEAEMRALPSWAVAIKATKAEVLVHLQRAAQLQMPMVYFYCHGGRSGNDTWLEVGRGQRLIPSDLEARDIDWTGANPLVIINGCHTSDLTPDDLLSFNQVFAWCQAAGVIGTEIDITEALARDFALGLFRGLSDGQTTVGEAMRNRRLSLLGRFNPLGLAYTPYCSAALHLAYQ